MVELLFATNLQFIHFERGELNLYLQSRPTNFQANLKTRAIVRERFSPFQHSVTKSLRE